MTEKKKKGSQRSRKKRKRDRQIKRGREREKLYNNFKLLNFFSFKKSFERNVRTKRSENGNVADCDFSSSPKSDLCGWENLNMTAFKWLPSTGLDSFWIGGPAKDKSADDNQGICL